MEFILRMQGWLNIWESINIIHHINSLEKKKNVSIDTEKALDKLQHPFMTTISKLGVEENVLNLQKAFLQGKEKLPHKHYTDGEKPNSFP